MYLRRGRKATLVRMNPTDHERFKKVCTDLGVKMNDVFRNGVALELERIKRAYPEKCEHGA